MLRKSCNDRLMSSNREPEKSSRLIAISRNKSVTACVGGDAILGDTG